MAQHNYFDQHSIFCGQFAARVRRQHELHGSVRHLLVVTPVKATARTVTVIGIFLSHREKQL
jgi:hypothetical protein